jgi:hypothetical protein
MKQVFKRLENVNIQCKNILSIYSQSTDNEISEGAKWYNNANNLCQLMSAKYNLSLPHTVGILAALSPATNWNQNVIDVNNLLSLLNAGKDIKSITVTTYGGNKLKAYYLYSHPELNENEIFKVLLGASKRVNKTSTFYLNILHPDIDQVVTIDRHSFRVNLGITKLTEIALTEKRYKLMSAAYIQASKHLEINAIQLQAVTWLTFRRLYTVSRDKKFEVSPF